MDTAGLTSPLEGAQKNAAIIQITLSRSRCCLIQSYVCRQTWKVDYTESDPGIQQAEAFNKRADEGISIVIFRRFFAEALLTEGYGRMANIQT